MYEAIVFLPLLGAVIAGAIALIGARNRLSGADPPPPGDDHAAPHADESHGHAAPSLHGAHDEEPAEPAAAGSRAAELITSTLLVLTVAAAEAAIGLAILVAYFRNRGSIAVDDINLMKG